MDDTNRAPARSKKLLKRLLLGTAVVISAVVLVMFLLINVVYQSYRVPTSSMEGTVLQGDYILANSASFVDGELPGRGTLCVFRFPGRRDEVVPAEEQKYLFRCVAVAGDTLEMRDGVLYVNGEKEIPVPGVQSREHPGYNPERDQYRTFPTGMGFTCQNWGPMRIPKAGDHLSLNIDSTVSADELFRRWNVFIGREGHVLEQSATGLNVDGERVLSYTVEKDYVFYLGDNRNDSQDSRYFGFGAAEDIIGISFLVYFSVSSEDGGVRWDRIAAGIE